MPDRTRSRLSPNCRAVLRAVDGSILADGRTGHLSSDGAFVIAKRVAVLPSDGKAAIELHDHITDEPIRWACVITSSESIGEFTGLAVRFTQRLAG